MDIKKQNEKLIHIILVILLVGVCIYHIDKMEFLAVLNDEFGYWGNASAIAGYDWRNLIQETPYYAWGYSVFLTPLMMLFKNYAVVYKAAIVLNVIFLSISFECAVYISKRLLKNKTIIALLLSFVVMLYPGNIVYSQVAWAETLLVMLMWLSVAAVVALEECFSWKKYVFFLCTLGYMYIVHQRSIGIILIGIITAVFILKKYKKPVWSWFIPIVIFIGWYGLNSIVKDFQMEVYWSGSQFSGMNNVGLNTDTFSKYLGAMLYNLKELLLSMSGKFFYLLVATCGTILVTVFCVVYESIEHIREHRYSGFEPYFYIIGSLVAMWGICSLAMMGYSTRKDLLVYSRYMENAIGPFLLITLSWIINRHKLVKFGLICGMGLIIFQVKYVCTIIGEAEGQFNTICSPVMGAFFQSSESTEQMMLKISGVLLLSVLGMIFLWKYKETRYSWLGILCVFMWFYIVIIGEAENYTLDWRKELDKNITEVRNYVEENYPESDIFYIKDSAEDGYSVNPKYLQFMLPDRKITVVDKEQIDGEKIFEDSIILLNPATKNVLTGTRLELRTAMLSVYYVE